jgi:hypothetical protein
MERVASIICSDDLVAGQTSQQNRLGDHDCTNRLSCKVCNESEAPRKTNLCFVRRLLLMFFIDEIVSFFTYFLLHVSQQSPYAERHTPDDDVIAATHNIRDC